MGYDRDIDASRDEWMRRTGPLYPMLVASKLQSLLPIARDLEPDEEDRRRATLWLPAVGLAAGATLAILAVLLGRVLPPFAVAALVVGAGVLLTGACFEVGAARIAGAAADPEPEDRGVIAPSLALSTLLLVRFAALASIETGAWFGALLVAGLGARFAMMALLEAPALFAAGESLGMVDEPGEEGAGAARPRWVSLAVVTSVAFLASGLAGGGAGLLSLGAAAGGALLLVLLLRRRQESLKEGGASAAALAEVMTLLCFACLWPAS